MSPAVERYKTLLARLKAAEGDEETEDAILEEMDTLWYKHLTIAEHDICRQL